MSLVSKVSTHNIWKYVLHDLTRDLHLLSHHADLFRCFGLLPVFYRSHLLEEQMGRLGRILGYKSADCLRQ